MLDAKNNIFLIEIIYNPIRKFILSISSFVKSSGCVSGMESIRCSNYRYAQKLLSSYIIRSYAFIMTWYKNKRFPTCIRMYRLPVVSFARKRFELDKKHVYEISLCKQSMSENLYCQAWAADEPCFSSAIHQRLMLDKVWLDIGSRIGIHLCCSSYS